MGESPDVEGAPTAACWHPAGRTGDDAVTGGAALPRYVVERTFPDGLVVPTTAEGATTCLGVVDRNAEQGVTWVQSYVSDDKRSTFCVYDGPDPEAIRRAAERTGLPVDRITKVSVLDPYFYH
jgi:uncharacterized protein DUF4242